MTSNDGGMNAVTLIIIITWKEIAPFWAVLEKYKNLDLINSGIYQRTKFLTWSNYTLARLKAFEDD